MLWDKWSDHHDPVQGVAALLHPLNVGKLDDIYEGMKDDDWQPFMPSCSGRNIAKIKLSLVTANAETTKFEFSQPGRTNGQAAE